MEKRDERMKTTGEKRCRWERTTTYKSEEQKRKRSKSEKERQKY